MRSDFTHAYVNLGDVLMKLNQLVRLLGFLF